MTPTSLGQCFLTGIRSTSVSPADPGLLYPRAALPTQPAITPGGLGCTQELCVSPKPQFWRQGLPSALWTPVLPSSQKALPLGGFGVSLLGNPQAVGLGLNSCLRDGQIQMPSLHIFPYMVRVIEARILRWELIPGHLWALNAITGVPGGGGGALAYTEEQRHETGQREGGRCWP